jgi:hypothetical protein
MPEACSTARGRGRAIRQMCGDDDERRHRNFFQSHDPPAQRAVGEAVEVESDHYLTLREPQQLAELLIEFLGAAAPAEE